MEIFIEILTNISQKIETTKNNEDVNIAETFRNLRFNSSYNIY